MQVGPEGGCGWGRLQFGDLILWPIHIKLISFLLFTEFKLLKKLKKLEDFQKEL